MEYAKNKTIIQQKTEKPEYNFITQHNITIELKKLKKQRPVNS